MASFSLEQLILPAWNVFQISVLKICARGLLNFVWCIFAKLWSFVTTLNCFFFSLVDGPFLVFSCMMFFMMLNVFINDRISMSSLSSSCFTVPLWVVSVCNSSMESSIRKCISVSYWWCALITQCLGYKCLTLWWQGLNKSFNFFACLVHKKLSEMCIHC